MPGLSGARTDRHNGKQSWFDLFLNLIFPERCIFCRRILPAAPEQPLCSSCAPEFVPAGRICLRCEMPLSAAKDCLCRSTGFALQGLYALTRYEKRWRLVLHDLKYRSRRSLARPLGLWLGREISSNAYCKPDLVVPVPLHRRREKERGFNQSALVARHAARSLGCLYRPLLIRHRDTTSQTTLSRRERIENVRGAFALKSQPPSGSVILLVDDIYSTGSTLKEAAAALYRPGAKIYGAVIAYNPLDN